MRAVSSYSTLLAATCLLAPASAAAGDAPVGDAPDSSGIEGGEDAGTCAFPTTAMLGGGSCSATLVHPEVVVYAAHCGSGSGPIDLGENYAGGQKLQVEYCRTNPDYGGASDQEHDWAFCKLAQPVNDLPVAPILFGCETEALKPGAEVYVVGFGAPGYGQKTFAKTVINAVTDGAVDLGGGGVSACPGDSGGPAFIQLGDGTWRAFGIASTLRGSCGPGTNQHARMDAAVQWLETESGVDLTPCFASDGTWAPTLACGEFIASGPQGHGTWASWCEGTPTGGPSATCGAPFDADPDADPPTVAITTPMDGDFFAYEGELVEIPIEVDADDGGGWGVQSVALRIDGMDVGEESTTAPHTFAGAMFPEGVYELVAIAEDYAGNVATSDAVRIGVGVEVPPDEPPEDTDTGGGTGGDDPDAGETGGGDDGSADDSDEEPGADNGAEGCGCRAGRAAPVTLLLLGSAPAFVRRRRAR